MLNHFSFADFQQERVTHTLKKALFHSVDQNILIREMEDSSWI